MNIDRITYLVERLSRKDISDLERDELMSWYKDVSFRDAEYPAEEVQVKSKILYRLLDDTGFINKINARKRNKRVWFSTAAACLLFALAGLSYFLISPKISQQQVLVKDNNVDYLPGGNYAQLVLEDGAIVDLNSEQSSLLVGDDIIYGDGSKIDEQDTRFKVASSLQLIVPRGGQYQVTLADGTKVWLNSQTRLKYPRNFIGDERTVELDGEAYFEVAKNEHKPFIVKTNKQTIKVLGTKFNVSSYQDKNSTKTTLLEGLVSVITEHGNDLLAPGQELVVSNSGNAIHNVSPEDAIAWKNGLFVFDNIPLDEVMDKISKWYNVDIRFAKENLKNELVFAVIKKSENVSGVLEKIARTGVAKFQITRDGISVNN